MYDLWILVFFNHGFKFQDYVCNGCHGLTMSSVNISNIAIITSKSVDYRCIIHNVSKFEAINLLKSSVLEDRGYIWKAYCLKFQSTQDSFFFQFFCLGYIKWLVVSTSTSL